RVAAAAILVVGVVGSVAANVVALKDERAALQFKTHVTRAFIELALTRGEESWVDQKARLWWTPAAPQLVRSIERYGSPLEDTLLRRVAKPPSKAAHEAALLAMLGGGF